MHAKAQLSLDRLIRVVLLIVKGAQTKSQEQNQAALSLETFFLSSLSHPSARAL